MTFQNFDNTPHKYRPRDVASLLCPSLSVEGHHANNFVADTVTMLEQAGPFLSDRHCRFLESCLARRIKHNPLSADGREVKLTDVQWRHWRDIRSMFLAARHFYALNPLSIPARAA